MKINPTVINYIINSNIKYRRDLEAMAETMKFNQVLTQIKEAKDVAHLIDVQLKRHNDALFTDPTWINGVHCHNSISKHNYTNYEN